MDFYLQRIEVIWIKINIINHSHFKYFFGYWVIII